MTFTKLKTIALCLLFIPAFAFSGCAENGACKVENVGGVPRITIDGKAVRPRMLYVSPTYFLLGTPTKRTAFNYSNWVETFVEIPKLERPVKGGEIRIDAYSGPCEYAVAGLEIIEADTGKKVYEIDVKNGDGRVKTLPEGKTESSFGKWSDGTDALKIKSKANGKFTAVLREVNLDAGKVYKINIKIKGSKTFDFDMYLAENGKFLEPKVRSFVGPQTKMAKEAGVDMITFPVQAADFMPEDGKSYNFNNLKGALDEIVEANPNAKILVRIRFYPPKWWLEKYPDDVMTSADGGKTTFPCVSSERFRNDSVDVLKMIIDFCEKNYGKNIMGYHPGGGNSSEWFYGNSWNKTWYGYNKTAAQAWKKWVSKKYKTDDDLKKAWNDPNAALAGVKVPSPEERMGALYVINPKTQAKLADYNTFLQDEMVDMVEHLGKIIRQKVPNKISALFYGYTCEFSISVNKGPANTGHYALWKIANSPYFDILSGPVSYRDRNLGDPGYAMGAAETVARCGKIWFDEDDIRTHRTPQTQQKIAALGNELRNASDTIKVLQRDMARQAIRNQGCWWMDLAGTGWYLDPKLWELMPKFNAMEMDMIQNPVSYVPEVAVITDERSVYYSGTNGTPTQTTNALAKSRTHLGKCPAPLGYYLFDDFASGKPKIKPKLAVFPIEYALDAKQRKTMRKKTKNCAAVFVWAPGYVDLDKKEFSKKAVEEATGFEVSVLRDTVKAKVKPTDEGKKIGLDESFGFNVAVKPLLSPKAEDGDTVLAVYENGMPAVVLRGKHLFCGVADIPFKLYWHMLKISGAHMYAQSPVSVYASGAYVSVTSVDEGDKARGIEIDVNSDKEIFDALTGEKLGKGPKITLNMKRGDNRVLRLGAGNSEFAK